jgi:hypothetical protein
MCVRSNEKRFNEITGFGNGQQICFLDNDDDLLSNPAVTKDFLYVP